jgi:hypothetical protein
VRHAIGILLGLLLAPLLLGGAGWGFVRATHVAAVLDPKSSEVLSGLAVLVLAGVVVGLLAAARWPPPSTALVVGLAYLGVTAFYVVAVDRFTTELVKHGELGEGIFGFIRTGTAALLGGLLLVSAAMPRRWAAAEPPAAPEAAEPLYAELPPYQTGGYTTPGSSASGYSGPDYSGQGGSTSGYGQGGSSSGYGQGGSTSGYSQGGSTSGYGQGGYSQSGYSSPGYAAGSGQHRAPDSGASANPYFDEPTSQ